MASLRDFSINKAASVVTLDALRKGLLGKSDAFAVLQGLADELGMVGESPAQRFNKAFASGSANRLVAGDGGLSQGQRKRVGANICDSPAHALPTGAASAARTAVGAFDGAAADATSKAIPSDASAAASSTVGIIVLDDALGDRKGHTPSVRSVE